MYIYICICVYVYICIYIHIYACIFICINFICIFIHIHNTSIKSFYMEAFLSPVYSTFILSQQTPPSSLSLFAEYWNDCAGRTTPMLFASWHLHALFFYPCRPSWPAATGVWVKVWVRVWL